MVSHTGNMVLGEMREETKLSSRLRGGVNVVVNVPASFKFVRRLRLENIE